MDQQQPSHNKGLGIGIAVAAVAAVVAVTAFGGGKQPDVVQPDVVETTTDATTTQTPPKAATSPTKTSIYRDGTYTASTSYNSPGGMDQIKVTLTLKNDVVMDVTTTASGDKTSERYQAMFLADYKQYVVGKNIASVKLDKVSGSSLTPAGFNDALAKIKAQAKA